MKNRYLFTIIISILAISCIKDDTVNSFKKLNEVTITGLENSYSFNLFEEVEIKPVITTSEKNESNLDFRWYMYNTNHRFAADTISKEKNLKVVMGGTPGLPYTLVFKVIDKLTGVYYSKTMSAQVFGALTKGTMFLCEEDGVVDVNFMKPDSTITRGIYKSANPGETLGSNPLGIFFINPNASKPLIMKHVYITTNSANGGAIVDPITFKRVKWLRDNFYVLPTYPNLKPTLYFKGSLADYFFINGKLFNRAANMADPLWKPELLITALDQPREYDLADLLIFPTGSPIIFDNKYGRFLQHNPENKGELFAFVGGSKAAFDYNNSGLKMHFCAQTTLPVGSIGRYGFAITEDPKTGKRYMLKYLLGRRNPDVLFSVYADEKREITSAGYPGLFAATTYASDFATMQGVLWYASGGKLYSLNSFDAQPVEVLQKDFTSQGIVIDLIKFFTYTVLDPLTGKNVSVTELRLAVRNNTLTTKKAGMIYMRGNTVGGVNITETGRKFGIADRIFAFDEKLN
ncbi:MAG: PKD-like family lipoprotein [Bacteroidales bacterium]|nr:PKD-like family lipoprotein [Bacteroidales bacterium]